MLADQGRVRINNTWEVTCWRTKDVYVLTIIIIIILFLYSGNSRMADRCAVQEI